MENTEYKLKYTTLLKFINKILKKNNKEEIDDLTKFVNIDRDIIIKEGQVLVDMKDDIFKHFDKKICGWFKRNTVRYYILSFLRYACNDINYKFTLNQKDMTEEIGDKKYRRTHMLYTIKKV